MWRGSQVTVDLYNYYKNRAENGITKLEYRDFEGYYSISARADYWLLNNLSLFVDVTNLLNNQDIVTGYPRSGRRISFGFNCHL